MPLKIFKPFSGFRRQSSNQQDALYSNRDDDIFIPKREHPQPRRKAFSRGFSGWRSQSAESVLPVLPPNFTRREDNRDSLNFDGDSYVEIPREHAREPSTHYAPSSHGAIPSQRAFRAERAMSQNSYEPSVHHFGAPPTVPTVEDIYSDPGTPMSSISQNLYPMGGYAGRDLGREPVHHEHEMISRTASADSQNTETYPDELEGRKHPAFSQPSSQNTARQALRSSNFPRSSGSVTPPGSGNRSVHPPAPRSVPSSVQSIPYSTHLSPPSVHSSHSIHSSRSRAMSQPPGVAIMRNEQHCPPPGSHRSRGGVEDHPPSSEHDIGSPPSQRSRPSKKTQGYEEQPFRHDRDMQSPRSHRSRRSEEQPIRRDRALGSHRRERSEPYQEHAQYIPDYSPDTYYIIPAGVNVIFQDEHGREIKRVGDFSGKGPSRAPYREAPLIVQDEFGREIYRTPGFGNGSSVASSDRVSYMDHYGSSQGSELSRGPGSPNIILLDSSGRQIPLTSSSASMSSGGSHHRGGSYGSEFRRY